MKIDRFEDIDAWKEARKLTKSIYNASKQNSFYKDYGLRDQIRKASVSIMANIAEGFDSQTNPQFIKFLNYSRRSCTEVQSHLYVAVDQKYVSPRKFDEIYNQTITVKNLVGGFIRYLRDSSRKS